MRESRDECAAFISMEELVLFLPADKAKKGVIHMSKKEKGTFTINECYLMMFSEYEDIVTANEVAQMMRLPVKRVYRMFRSGELKSFKGEREVRTCKLWVIEYIQQYGFIRQESFRKQRKAAVTVFCQEPKSRKQIQEFLDLADRKFFLDSVLLPLVESGVLKMTIPDDPSSVKQRYVATKVLSPAECDLVELE